MKKMIFTLFTLLTIALGTNAMSYEQARNEALFLTDKMAYELNLSDSQYEAAYEINLDYLMSVTSFDDVNGIWWERRNQDLRYILYSWQWDAFCAASYFFRPLYWSGGYWHFGVYARYPRRDYFYFGRPHFYASYRGGHSWRLNGGRSYYEHRVDMFRPGHVSRDHHFGMRNSFDRGDYRGRQHGNSSTRVTVGDRRHDSHGWNDNGSRRSGNDNNSWRNNRENQNHHDSGRQHSTGTSRDSRDNRGSYNGGTNSDRSVGSNHFGGSRSQEHSRSVGTSGSYSGSHSQTPSRSVGTSGSYSGSRSQTPSRSVGSSGSPSSTRSFGGGGQSHSSRSAHGGSDHGGRNGSSRR